MATDPNLIRDLMGIGIPPLQANYIGPLLAQTNTDATVWSITATKAIAAASATGAFAYGTLAYADTNLVETFNVSVNSYCQNIMSNASAGTSASADYIVSNNQGSANTHYGDFGINSSGYTNGTGSLALAGATYLYAAGGELVLGTWGANGFHISINQGAIDAFYIDQYSSVIAGLPALVTTATDGFLYIPGGAGAPTGVPTAHAGSYPLYWDHTDKKLYLYDGGWLGSTAPGVWS